MEKLSFIKKKEPTSETTENKPLEQEQVAKLQQAVSLINEVLSGENSEAGSLKDANLRDALEKM